MSFPVLPWDSPEVREWRTKAQKKYEQEELLAWLLYRRFSIYLSLLLAYSSRLSPNLITAVGVFMGLLGACLPWLVMSEVGIFLSVLAVHLSYFLDLVDGEMARIRGQFSDVGRWLDRLLEGALLAAVLSMGVRILSDVGLGEYIGFWISAVFARVFARHGFIEVISVLPTSSLRVRSVGLNVLSLASGPLGFTLWILFAVLFKLLVLLVFPYFLFALGTGYQLAYLFLIVSKHAGGGIEESY